MNRNPRGPFWILLTVLLLILAAGAALLWRGLQGPPALDEILALARQRRFDQAQRLMDGYLRAFPDEGRAHLLMAQFAMDRPDPQPEVALEHLARIRGGTPREAAVVRFSEGKALYQQKRYDLAEASWRRALEIDPTVPEAGWALLDLLDFQGRLDEAHELGMRLHEVEPDPRDRVRLLLEMIRIDIDKVAPGSQVQVFEPVYRQVPENLALARVVGLALIHDSRPEEGLAILEDALRRHPDQADAWDWWLTGLDDAFRPDQLRREFARLPRPLAADPRFAKHEGSVAQSLRDWPRAVAAYRRALAFEPFNGVVLYRLRMALRSSGDTGEADRVERLLTTYQTAFKQMRGVYEEAKAVPTLGIQPHTELCHRLAALREQLGRLDEACAWHRLVLRTTPDDPASLAALARLK
jgi:tetratricopeptide (TPR) repeat protein